MKASKTDSEQERPKSRKSNKQEKRKQEKAGKTNKHSSMYATIIKERWQGIEQKRNLKVSKKENQ